jgi:hypothetical protein
LSSVKIPKFSKKNFFLKIHFYRKSFLVFLNLAFFDKKNKTNAAKHEISKWHPNLRWMSMRFYRLKLVFFIIF